MARQTGGAGVRATRSPFVIAIALHIRARDFGRNLYLNATGMLVLCVAVALVSFVL